MSQVMIKYGLQTRRDKESKIIHSGHECCQVTRLPSRKMASTLEATSAARLRCAPAKCLTQQKNKQTNKNNNACCGLCVLCPCVRDLIPQHGSLVRCEAVGGILVMKNSDLWVNILLARGA